MATRTGEGWKGSGLLKDPGIPAPSGQYRVGCVDLMEGDDKGGLLVRLHYPTEASPGAKFSYTPWLPHRSYIKGYLSSGPSSFTGIVSWILNGLLSPKVPALNGAPLLVSHGEAEGEGTTPPTFPVIVFSHGLRAMRTTYSGIVCDLASHGYLVACVEHRSGSACACLQRVPKPGGQEGEFQDQWIEYQTHDVPKVTDDPVGNAEAEFPYRSEQVKKRADDVKKTLDLLTLLNEGGEIKNMLEGSYDFKQFKGRMDVNTAAVMGHSYGGATTIQTLAEDSRFKCGIGLDSWMIPIDSAIYSNCASISQPLYFINSYSFQWQENMKRMLSLKKPMDNNNRTTCRILTLKGTGHLSQSDIPFVFNRTIVKIFNLDQAELDCEIAHRVNMDICHAFFKRYLLIDPAYQGDVPNLDGTEGHSEHILFGTNVKVTSEAPEEAPAEGEGLEDGAGKGEEQEEAGADKGEGPEEGADKEKGLEESSVDKGEGPESADEGEGLDEEVGETPIEGEELKGATDDVKDVPE